MIARGECMGTIISRFPGFRDHWEAHLANWAGKEHELCIDISAFSHYVADLIEKGDAGSLPEIFELIETLMTEGDDDVKNAAATCFLENIQNAASGGSFPDRAFAHLLGPECRAYCRAWDEFTGEPTEGLWDAGEWTPERWQAMRPARTLRASRLVDLQDITSGRPCRSVFTGPSSDIVVVAAEDRGALRIYHYLANRRKELVRLPRLERDPSFVQPMPRGNWLLVASRAVDESDRNAFIYSKSGRLLRSFHAGDAIEDVQTTVDGLIWISYFDEGTTGHNPLAVHGLVCLTEDGSPVFRYLDYAEAQAAPPIADCYALNVASSSETWVHYYSAFPLVRLLDRRFYQVWQDLPVHGARSFAVGSTHAIFVGGRHPEPGYEGPPGSTSLASSPAPWIVTLVDLQSMRSECVQVVSDDGEPLQIDGASGRGSHLYLSAGSTLHVVDLRSALEE